MERQKSILKLKPEAVKLVTDRGVTLPNDEK